MKILNSTLFIFSSILAISSCQKVKHIEWMDGEIRHEMDYIGDTNHEFEGDEKTYYPTGELYAKFHNKNTHVEGILRLYRKNGKLFQEIYYKQSKKDGIYNTFYENGETHYEKTYSNDSLNGFEAYYYPDGKISNYILNVNGSQIYYISFDGKGKIEKNGWDYYIETPSSIHQGEKIQAHIKVPVIKGLNHASDFKINVYAQASDDTLSNYELHVTSIRKGITEYALINNINHIKTLVKTQNINIDEKGNAVFEYQPLKIGQYVF